MEELRFTGDPYTDREAGNVCDGSVDYHDFDWGRAVYHPDENQIKDETCAGCGMGCAAEVTEVGTQQASAYEIIEE